MLYIITAVVSCFGIVRKKSKIVFVNFFLLMWIMFGFSYGNADYYSYLHTFENINIIDLNASVGLRFTFGLFNKLGASYQTFLIIFSLIGLVIISKAIFKYTNNINFVLFLYLLFPFVLDITQIKNFIVTAILTYSIYYLVSDAKFSTIKYIIFILLATMFHYASIFYLLLLIVKYFDRRMVSIITLITVILLGVAGNTDIFFSIATKILPTEWVSIRLYQGTDVGLYSIILRYFRIVSIFIVYMIISHSVTRFFLSKKQKYIETNNIKILTDIEFKLKFIDVVTKINILLLITLPLMAYSQELYRIQQNILLTNYIIFSMGLGINKYNTFRRLSLFLLLLFCSFILLYFVVLRYNFDTVFSPVFEQNILLRWF